MAIIKGSPAYPSKARPSRPAAVDADVIAIQALTFIASDPERAERFFTISGLAPSDLRRAATDPGFLRGVMDYLVGDEPLLLDLAAAIGVAPESIASAQELIARR